MDSEKSMNSFEVENGIGYLNIYWIIGFFSDWLINFLHCYYYAKLMLLIFLKWLNFKDFSYTGWPIS